MKIGPLRKRVIVQTPTETADSFGQMVQTWATVGTYWAEVRFLSGREAANAKQIKAEITHQIRMRRFGPLSPSQRILFGSRVFAIISVNDVDERKREYLINAMEIAVPATSP